MKSTYEIEYQFFKPLNINFISSYDIKNSNASTFSLEKQPIAKKIKINMPPQVHETLQRAKSEKNKIYPKYIPLINHFYNTICEKIPYVNLEMFNNNIRDLTIIERETLSKKRLISKFQKTILGIYNIGKNRIKTLSDNYIFSIFHELFHMSSSIIEHNMIFSGFYQSFRNYSDFSKPKYKSFKIGYGLDEGYTELLTQRYFGDIVNIQSQAYEVGKYFSQMLEIVVGKERMEKFYFSADLYGLVKELEQYQTEESILKFLKSLDFIVKKDNSALNKHQYEVCVSYASKFLFKCFEGKIYRMYESPIFNSINQETYAKALGAFTKCLNDITVNLESMDEYILLKNLSDIDEHNVFKIDNKIK